MGIMKFYRKIQDSWIISKGAILTREPISITLILMIFLIKKTVTEMVSEAPESLSAYTMFKVRLKCLRRVDSPLQARSFRS